MASIKELAHFCESCLYEYPDDVLLSPIGGRVTTGPVCGICALEITGAVFGLKRAAFHGPMAEKARQDAIRARASGLAKPPAPEATHAS